MKFLIKLLLITFFAVINITINCNDFKHSIERGDIIVEFCFDKQINIGLVKIFNKFGRLQSTQNNVIWNHEIIKSYGSLDKEIFTLLFYVISTTDEDNFNLKYLTGKIESITEIYYKQMKSALETLTATAASSTALTSSSATTLSAEPQLIECNFRSYSRCFKCDKYFSTDELLQNHHCKGYAL